MRDGRRKRLGLATGTEDPATSNDGYLDRILSDAEAAEQSNILNLAQDANVNVRDQRYLNDAYQYYLGGGTGNFADEVAIAPDFIGGQLIDTGGGAGQATSGVDLGAGTGNTDFEQNLLDQSIGVQGAIGDPVVAPGEMLSTQAEMDAFNQIPVTPQTYADTGRADLLEQAGGEDYGDGGFQEEGSFDDQFQDIESIGLPETNIVDEVALTGQPTAVNDLGEITADDYGTNTFAGNTATLEDAGGTYDGNQSAEGGFGLESEFAPYGRNPNTGEAYQTPRSISDQNAVLGQTFAAEDVDTQGNLLQSGIDKMKSIFPDFNPIVAAGKIAFNSYIGAPVTLVLDALKAVLPEPDKYNEEALGALGEIDMLKTTEGGLTVDKYGINVESMLGDYDDYNLERQLNLEDVVTRQEKEGNFNTLQAKELEDRKAIEKKLNETRLEEAGQEQQDFVQEIQDQTPVQSGSDDARDQQRDTGVASVDSGIGGKGSGGYQTTGGDVYASASEAAEKGNGGGGGGGKIVCTMMNDSYGFGSFRNKIWLKHSKDMAPEYQKGYHKIFLPLVKLSKTNKVLKKILEHIAIHRTIDIRQEARDKTHLLGRVYRKILEPVCYLVGKYAK